MPDPLRAQLIEGSGKLLWAATVMERLVNFLTDPPDEHATTLCWLRRELFPEVEDHVWTEDARVAEGQAAADVAEAAIVVHKPRTLGKSTVPTEILFAAPVRQQADASWECQVQRGTVHLEGPCACKVPAPRKADPLAFLGDAPLTVTLNEAAREFIARCEALAEGEAQFATDTLCGIAESVRMSGRATPGQVNAVDNIEAGAQRGREARESRGGSRRWEGFGGRRR